MYHHVIENTQRNGQPVYRHVKTYVRYPALEKWLLKTGKPVWVISTRNPILTINGQHSQPTLGGFIASYWNTGGWGTTTMPVLPLVVTDTTPLASK